jgi:hypothetical protein
MKAKPILILCNSLESGKEYYEDHLMDTNQGKRRSDDNWVHIYAIWNCDLLAKTLKRYKGRDFDGCILPEFKTNPERIAIFGAIHNHKLGIDKKSASDFWTKAFTKSNNVNPSPGVPLFS